MDASKSPQPTVCLFLLVWLHQIADDKQPYWLLHKRHFRRPWLPVDEAQLAVVEVLVVAAIRAELAVDGALLLLAGAQTCDGWWYNYKAIGFLSDLRHDCSKN